MSRQLWFSRNKKLFSFIMLLLCSGLYANAAAMTFEMKLVASIPNPVILGETLSTRVMLGAEDQATDRFDTAWDVVAIGGGMLQAYIAHPEYDMATQALWRDTRTSTGLPKQWDLEVFPSQSRTSVTLNWSPTDLSGLPSSVRMRLIDLDGDNQEIDMRSASTYTYLHVDQARAHHFQIILDEPTTATPPSDSAPPPGNTGPPNNRPPQNTPPVQTPPVETPPAVSPPLPGILTDFLPTGFLQRHYTARLEAQGGTAPYHWEIISGGLPKGLELDTTTGIIKGKPRRIGQYRLMVKLTDASGRIYKKAFTLSIARRASPPH